MWTQFIVAVVFLVCLFGQASTTSKTPKRALNIRGYVYDIEGRALKGVQVTLSNGQRSIMTLTNEQGTFVVSIYPGTSKLKIVGDGYCPLSENISAAVGSSATHDFVLFDCSDCPKMDIDFAPMKIEPDGSAPVLPTPRQFVFDYTTENLVGQEFGKLGARIHFGRKTEQANNTLYEGLDCPGYQKNPIITYDGGTISAEKLIVSKQDAVVKGERNVVLIDERGMRRGSSAKVDFSEGTPVADIVKQ